MKKFRNGAFVFTRCRGLVPRNREKLEPLATAHGFDSAIIPKYAGDRASIGRAIAQTSTGLWKQGFLLRPIKRSQAEVVYGIVREKQDGHAKRVDHEFESIVSWKFEPDPSIVEGPHKIARRVADKYSKLQGKIVAEDWSGSITSYLESLGAVRMRSDGRVYWIPPIHIGSVRKLQSLLKDVGIDLVLCELEPESRSIVKDAADGNLADELERLQMQCDQFDGNQKPSTYARRLDEFQRLRERAILYRESLGLGVEQAENILSELESKVSRMFSLRKKRKVKRTPKHTPTHQPATEKVNDTPKLLFGGGSFNMSRSADPNLLCFTANGSKAMPTIEKLKSIGLIGKWQKAGMIEVCFKNSGPPEAPASIDLKIPTGTDLKSSASQLATLGITLEL